MPDLWYYGKDEQRFGPVPLKELRTLASSGQLQPTDLVWLPGMADWSPAAEVEGLFSSTIPAAASSSSPPPPAAATSPISPPAHESPVAEDRWYYEDQGERRGPVSFGELKQRATSGQIQPDSLVWKRGMAEWTPAGQIDGLFPVRVEPATEPNVLWYYGDGEQRHGPVSMEELKALASSRQLQPNHLVWKRGMADWLSATEVEGLFSAQVLPIGSSKSSVNQEHSKPPADSARKSFPRILLVGVAGLCVVLLVVLFVNHPKELAKKKSWVASQPVLQPVKPDQPKTEAISKVEAEAETTKAETAKAAEAKAEAEPKLSEKAEADAETAKMMAAWTAKAAAEARAKADAEARAKAEVEAKVPKPVEPKPATTDLERAQATLKTNPTDPEANLTVGKHLCFAEDKWADGLPMLAQGSDAKLKDLAAADLKEGASAKGHIKLGDAWWDFAADKAGPDWKGSAGRAAYWYRKAVGSGTEKKAELQSKIAIVQQIPEGFMVVNRRSNTIPSKEYCTVRCNHLSLEAQRTDKMPEKQGALCAGVAGLELKGVRFLDLGVKVSSELGAKNKNTFAGFMVDYQTAGGYTKRVALGLGEVRKDRKSNVPSAIGKGDVPDDFVDLGVKETYELDLQQWAPPGWTGQVWFNLVLQQRKADTFLKAELMPVANRNH